MDISGGIGGGIGSGISGLGGMFSSFMHPEKGYEAALDELRKRFDESKGYLMPYNQQGQQQYGTLSGGIDQLLHPEDLMSRFVSSYQESPYAQQLANESNQQGLNDASSMGLMGSSAALKNMQQGAGRIVSADRQEYLSNMMKNFLSGLGLSQNIYNRGEDAASSLMKGTNDMGNLEAMLAYGKQNAPGNTFENLLSMGANAAKGIGGFLG